MAHSLWRRILAAGANQKLPEPLSPAIERIIKLFDDPTAWKRRPNRNSMFDYEVDGPCNVLIRVFSWESTSYHVYVNGDEVVLNKTDRGAIRDAFYGWLTYHRSERSRQEAEEKKGREGRILNHLDECLCA